MIKGQMDVYDALREMGQPLTLKGAEYARALAEVVEWDEYGQGYGRGAEVVICICGEPYPHRKTHYCPADEELDKDPTSW